MSDKQVRLSPNPSILVESLRDIGYSFNSALADVIDNSIAAGATTVRIFAIPTDEFQVGVIDDGIGLDRDNLLKAMRLGSTSPRAERSSTDLGRFGLGLKTASFSQCRRLTVTSRQQGKTSSFTWDLDLVQMHNEWSIIKNSDLSQIPFIEELGDSGTLVSWEKVDRLNSSRGKRRVNHGRIISEAQDYLSLVFHRYLAGETGLKRVHISFNNIALDPVDPFNSKHKATQVSPSEIVCPGVSMQAYTLPHRSHYSSQQEYDQSGLVGGYLKNQGVYLYRAKRLILYGSWFGITKKTALTQLTRVRIDIDTNQDDSWRIDVKKVSAEMPEVVRERLKTLIKAIGAPSRKAYRRRAIQVTSATAYPAWTVQQAGEKRLYSINREHPVIENLIDSLGADAAQNVETVLSLIESSFPAESVFYDLANNEESVLFSDMSEDNFSMAVRDFFSAMKQHNKSEDTILSIMHSTEPFHSRWEATIKALGIQEF